MSWSNLSGADLTDAMMINARLDYSNLRRTDVHGTIMPDGFTMSSQD
ncbi:MAG: pentapeptide repeat-containing protein [Nodosilinea sp.]